LTKVLTFQRGNLAILIWDNLPQGPIDEAVKDFSKRLKACVEAGGGHFEYLK